MINIRYNTILTNSILYIISTHIITITLIIYTYINPIDPFLPIPPKNLHIYSSQDTLHTKHDTL